MSGRKCRTRPCASSMASASPTSLSKPARTAPPATRSEVEAMTSSTPSPVQGKERIANSVLDLVGKTPLIRLDRLRPAGAAEVVAKVESRNPGGSVKDRIALGMIEDAESRGLIKPG